MPEFTPKPLPYFDRLLKVQRIMKVAIYRPDPKLALRELCEAVTELATALIEREQAYRLLYSPPPTEEPKPPPKPN